MGGVDDLFTLRFTVFRAVQSVQSVGGVDDLFCSKIHSIHSIQSMGGVDDLFALKFRAFRAWGL